MSISAVKGYCSALNSVLALKGRDLASSREITTVLRSFSKSVNPVELRPPAWDVSLVLQSFTGAPYEPLRTCEERFLAQCCVLCFRHVAVALQDLLAPRLAGFTVPARSTRE